MHRVRRDLARKAGDGSMSGPPVFPRSRKYVPTHHIVGRRGLEPRTYGLKVRSSTIELATRWGHSTRLASLFSRPLNRGRAIWR